MTKNELSIGKALVPVENKGKKCKGCHFEKMTSANTDFCSVLKCARDERSDGKNVIYKIKNWPK